MGAVLGMIIVVVWGGGATCIWAAVMGLHWVLVCVFAAVMVLFDGFVLRTIGTVCHIGNTCALIFHC